jgi:adenosine deaminase CECR1
MDLPMHAHAMFRNLASIVIAAFALAGLLCGVAGPARAGPFAERFETIKSESTPEELYRFLYDLPKGGDLHNHLSGSSRSDWWYELATDEARNGGYRYYTKLKIHNCPGGLARPATARRPYLLYFHTIQESTYRQLDECQQREYQPLSELGDRDRDAWLSSLRLDRDEEGRNEFFELIWPRIGELFRNPYISVDLLVENMKRYGAEGLRYLETQAGAHGYVDAQGNPIPVDDVVTMYRERLRQPDARATGVTVRFLFTFLRFAPDAEENLREAYAFVDGYRDLWVGINMAGREDNDQGHPGRFLETYREMRRKYHGIRLSIHAGELDRPSRHVRETLLLGADRIGHGVDVINDPETMLLMRHGPYLVETSLISNHLLEYTPDLSTHPFPEYLRTGIPVALSTDDRGMWDSNMSDEYYVAVTEFDLSWPEIVKIGRNSLEHAFAPEDVKDEMLEAYDNDVVAFERKYSRNDWRAALRRVRPETYTYAERYLGIAFK